MCYRVIESEKKECADEGIYIVKCNQRLASHHGLFGGIFTFKNIFIDIACLSA